MHSTELATKLTMLNDNLSLVSILILSFISSRHIQMMLCSFHMNWNPLSRTKVLFPLLLWRSLISPSLSMYYLDFHLILSTPSLLHFHSFSQPDSKWDFFFYHYPTCFLITSHPWSILFDLLDLLTPVIGYLKNQTYASKSSRNHPFKY